MFKSVNIKFILLFFIAVAMCCNMFITLGRTGQVGFFTVISVLIFQYFQYNKIKSLLIVLTIIPVIFFTAYQASPYFKLRVDNTMVAVGNFEQDNSELILLMILLIVAALGFLASI